MPENSFRNLKLRMTIQNRLDRPELPFETPAYTKTEIMRMPVAQLRALAEQLGIEGATSLNGNELKEQIIALLYL